MTEQLSLFHFTWVIKPQKKVEEEITMKVQATVKVEGGENRIGIASEVVANFVSCNGNNEVRFIITH